MLDAIFLSAVEIVNRPMEGAAYDWVVATAATTDRDVLGDPNDDGAVGARCNAMLWVRTGQQSYYDTVVEIIEAAMGTECGHSSSPVRVHALKLGTLAEAALLDSFVFQRRIGAQRASKGTAATGSPVPVHDLPFQTR